jgi:chemosensory pili system protein ChpA (sensor histidine kinase/response regulator)
MEHALPPEDHEARVVDLRPRHAARKLLDAESELDALRTRLDAVVAERDAARDAARDAQADALNIREELAGRLAVETEALSAVAVLRGQVEELRVRADARDARDATLARLAGELAATARAAREEVERHAAARAQAEAALEVERRRIEEIEGVLAAERDRAAKAEGALRAELETLRAARDRAVTAEAEAQAARRAELEALTAARDRLQPAEAAVVMPDGLILDLGRAAQRLRVESARPSGLRRLVARLRGR